ncbi:MAG TPA: DUF2935 domain-containing protein [Lachnospiraceae bacterium]|nr:DUF2935 domain-containing protein [Lachnospiraceae bacterium]
MYTDNYVVKSLEQHLFFGRIMKEHSLFLKAGFTLADPSFSKRAEYYKREFESLLWQAVILGDGIISREVLHSGEIVTEFTAMAEKQTECFTGIQINKEITSKELRLSPCYNLRCESSVKYCQVQKLNQTALRLLDGLISLKEEILQNVLCCKMYTVNYPLLIEHIIREAKLYREFIRTLEREHNLNDQSMKDLECFWNQIMMEHAMFIRGLLDPTEMDLYHSADDFAKEYSALLTTCHSAYDQTLTAASLEATMKFRDFKKAGAEGIEQCKIRSIILPLLADHVLREANHYIRLLQY